MKSNKYQSFIKFALICFVTILFMHTAHAFADPGDIPSGISIGGKSNLSEMSGLQNALTTIQSIGFNWVAKVIGGFLVIIGIYKIATRDFMSGILATTCGGCLFFVGKIVEALSKMSGT